MQLSKEIESLQQTPVFIIGAGGIVSTAHLPAYRLAGFHVAGIFDTDNKKAISVAAQFSIPQVFSSLQEMLDQYTEGVVFDIAVPGKELLSVLKQLPHGAAVLMQKPMGEDLQSAKEIADLCTKNHLIAGVNFQLRYAPFILEAKEMISNGLIGSLVDIEINVNTYTPWQLWNFLFDAARVEILYHSIHYIDLVRHLLGNPAAVYCKTTKHEAMKELASVRSNIIMDYGDWVRANILTNHCHDFGNGRQQSYIKLEGTAGAILIEMGLLKNYPEGTADRFEYTIKNEINGEWKVKEIEGTWFPHAFAGSMEQVMLAAKGIIAQPDNSVADCLHTMACVEACYESSLKGGTVPQY